ncbi:heavy-metal-associated domain-containing protein [Carboxylicivirga sediminis]|uniref:Heavy-metal-associated domain-containing protein n=1 Tax=Carboxylicivirga sediminis TaxID=2006564 RepID=A0A941F4J8_9BACT|nr:heavy-metal-associated domain-containing protein [Carboxylicivirga sediminis]MBR8536718.1 heavy-metal-associated domain-containing protein [Carboxylicivirga sediminis]
MKAKVFLLVALISTLGTLNALAHNETKSFKVYGNCGMCEKRIEKAAQSIDGVVSADWDKKTKQIKVVYNPHTADIKQVHKAIAKAGHDTEMIRAKDETYNKLPGCCQYDRAPVKKVDHSGHNH